MSRIGRKPVALPSGVTVDITPAVHSTTVGHADVVLARVTVKGPKGELSYFLLPEVDVTVEEGSAIVSRKVDTKDGRARHGLTRALLANMVTGVSTGYERKLEIIGVGYKAVLKGKVIQLSLGYSHTIDFAIPEGIEIVQDEKNKNLITIRGNDKQLVGQTAAQIRELRPPEPYKGKGIRYTDEFVRRKVGKTAGKTA